MKTTDLAKLEADLLEVFKAAIHEIGLPAFKATSFFGSSDAAFQAAKLEKATRRC